MRSGAAERAFAQQTPVALDRLADSLVDALAAAESEVQ
jgi:hypothetical protein